MDCFLTSLYHEIFCTGGFATVWHSKYTSPPWRMLSGLRFEPNFRVTIGASATQDHLSCENFATYDDNIRWQHTMTTYDDYIRWPHTMTTYDDRIRWPHTMTTHTMTTYDDHIRWQHSMTTYDDHIRWPHAMTTYDRWPHTTKFTKNMKIGELLEKIMVFYINAYFCNWYRTRIKLNKN